MAEDKGVQGLMTCKVTHIHSEKDHQRRPILIICFKDEQGKSYKTWTGKMFGNYSRWFSIIDMFHSSATAELWLDGLIVKGNKNLIDADSKFTYKRILKGEIIAPKETVDA